MTPIVLQCHAAALAHEIQSTAEALDTAVYEAILEPYGGPGAYGDHEDLVKWCGMEPDQAVDFLQDLRQENQVPGSVVQ